MAAAAVLKFAQLDGLRLAYREMGTGPAVLLLHGWPTSSFLWREVMRPIAARNRVVALDLPGFGASDKPLGVRYDFAFFARALDSFVDALGIQQMGLAVHDLGGPAGVHWALHRPGKVTKLALLNTLLYPQLSEAAKEFVRACSTPGEWERITSPEGLRAILREGLADRANLTDEVLAAVQEPFRTDAAREALALAGKGLGLRGFVEIARRLPSLQIPVRVVYGEDDRVLPDVAGTMARVKADVPHAEVTPLPRRGHFVQEEAPQYVGELLALFFAPRAE